MKSATVTSLLRRRQLSSSFVCHFNLNEESKIKYTKCTRALVYSVYRHEKEDEKKNNNVKVDDGERVNEQISHVCGYGKPIG